MATNKKRENIVIIFAKKPKIGEVKTRIAKETSFKFAYQFAKFCFLDLINRIGKSDYYDLIVAVDTYSDLSWFQDNFSLEGFVIGHGEKEGAFLGRSEKFNNIFKLFLNKNGYDYKKLVLIPMDVPFISEEDIISALVRFDKKKFVYGPEVNGGVYLIGVRAPYKNNFFEGIRWSSAYTFEDLFNKTGKKNSFVLKIKNDLNLPEDILNLEKKISYNCPMLYSFLKSNGYYLPEGNRFVDFDTLSICLPVVANIVQRKENGKIKILIQTRYKPTIDPRNSNKIEIPSGLIERYELAQRAAVRETFEETGIICRISSKQRVLDKIISDDTDTLVVYKPFSCHQQLSGGRSYLVLSFISDYVKGELTERFRETKNPRWISLLDLEKMIIEKPNDIFPLALSVLKRYLKFKKYEEKDRKRN